VEPCDTAAGFTVAAEVTADTLLAHLRSAP
jgi:hypothetical protein